MALDPVAAEALVLVTTHDFNQVSEDVTGRLCDAVGDVMIMASLEQIEFLTERLIYRAKRTLHDEAHKSAALVFKTLALDISNHENLPLLAQAELAQIMAAELTKNDTAARTTVNAATRLIEGTIAEFERQIADQMFAPTATASPQDPQRSGPWESINRLINRFSKPSPAV